MNLKVGDEVRVFDLNGSRMGQPPGGWPGTVVKIGRKYATVEYGHRHTGRYSETFDLETGRRNDKYGHRNIITLEQAALNEREHRAIQTLRAHGIDLRHGHQLSLEQIEALAQVAATFTEEVTG